MVTGKLLLLFGIQLTTSYTGVAGVPELGLSILSQHAVEGRPFQLQCVLEADGTGGVLIFKHRSGSQYISKCSVNRDTCNQYTGDITQYTCGCTKSNGNRVSHVLNIRKVNNETVGPWVCEYRKRSNEVVVELTDPEGPNSVSLSAISPFTIMEGQTVNVTCAAHCVPDCQFSWNTKSMAMFSQTRGDQGQSLVLEGVTIDQGGRYTCTALNPASGKTNHVSVLVKVQANGVENRNTDCANDDSFVLPFEAGVAIGAVGALLIVLLVYVAIRIRRKQDKDHHHPNTKHHSTLDATRTPAENHYQELSTAKLNQSL